LKPMPSSVHRTGATIPAIITVCLLALDITACSKEPTSTPNNIRNQTVDSPQAAELHIRHRVHNMEGMAAVAIEEGIALASFREGAIQGKVGIVMTDGRVEVVIHRVQRKHYSNPMAKVPTSNKEYEVLFTVTNRGNSKQVIEVVEGTIYSPSLEPIIRTITYHFDKKYNVTLISTELATGEFEEFHIPTMGREGAIQSVGIALKYKDKTESHFLVPVSLDQVRDV